MTQTLDGANAVSFETDIMISPTSNTAQLTLEPLNNKGRQPFSLVLTAEKDGAVSLSAKGLPKTVIGNSGEWIHLKVEYMNPVLDYDGDGVENFVLYQDITWKDSIRAVGKIFDDLCKIKGHKHLAYNLDYHTKRP